MTAAVHPGSVSAVDNFDRSISQPNICESPKRGQDGKTSKGKTDSVLSSASTITFSESSFSNLSDEHRASVDNSFGQRKDSAGSNKEDAKESKRTAVRDAGTKGCDCRRPVTLDRKVESFSPLIPVLEIIEPAEVVLEAKNVPPCCSATVTPMENMETVTVVVTTTSSSSNKTASPCINNSALPPSKTTSATPSFKGNQAKRTTIEELDSKATRLLSDAKSSNASLEAPLPSLTINESPEKSPSRLGGSLTDGYFSFSLLPLESKPPLPTASTSRIASTSPSRVKQGSQGDASYSPVVFVETSDAVSTDNTLVTAFGVESVSEMSLRETDIIEASASSESPPAITPLHVCEATVVMDSSPSRSDDVLHLSESFPPPPDELLVGFQQSVENLSVPEDRQPHPHSSGSAAVTAYGAGEVGLELPPLSAPSILAYMQNRQKQGDLYHVPGSSQRFLQEHPPTQQQLDTQYVEVSESIALASLNGANHKTLFAPPSGRSNRDLIGTKSLDAFNESEDQSSKKLSQTKTPSSPQVPGRSSFFLHFH